MNDAQKYPSGVGGEGEGMKTQFYWHVHHKVLCEPLTEPIEKRIAFIRMAKPKGEIETRLRLMKPVRGQLPAGVDKAGAAYDKASAASIKFWDAYIKARAAHDKARAAYGKAGAACDKAGVACDKAGVAYDKARAAYDKEIEALHAIECPNCPWDGETIFPEAKP